MIIDDSTYFLSLENKWTTQRNEKIIGFIENKLDCSGFHAHFENTSIVSCFSRMTELFGSRMKIGGITHIIFGIASALLLSLIWINHKYSKKYKRHTKRRTSERHHCIN